MIRIQENVLPNHIVKKPVKLIDDEVRKLIDEAYVRTKNLLTEKREKVEKLALALLDREVLHQQDVEDLIGKRPFEEKKIFSDSDELNQQALKNDEPESRPELAKENPTSIEAAN